MVDGRRRSNESKAGFRSHLMNCTASLLIGTVEKDVRQEAD